MNKFKLSSSLLAGILVAASVALAFIIRVSFSFSQIFTDKWVKYSSADAYYQMRLVDNLAHNFPSASNFDPYLIFPGGSSIVETRFYTTVLAAISSVFGLATPGQDAIDIVGVFTPPVLAALTVVIVFFIGKEIFGKWGGVFTAFLVAVIPGEFLSRTKLGFSDYHCFEVFITSLFLLLLLLGLKAARNNDLSFNMLRKPEWTALRKPLIYSVIAGIALGLFGLTWAGAPMFTFIAFIFLFVQFVVDHMKNRPTAYLGIVGAVTFLIAFLIVLPSGISTIVPASSLIAAAACIVLSAVSWFMAGKKLKSVYYPAVSVVLGGAGFGLLYLILPNIVNSMLRRFAIFNPTGTQLTTIEMQPLISSSYGNALAVVWNNYNTTFFIAIISLLILLYYVLKQGSMEKTFLLVWSVIILIANLGQRRFGYYYTINIALLTGFLTWLVIDYAWTHTFTDKVKQAIEKAKDPKRKARRRQQSNPLIAPYSVMSLVIIMVFFTGYFWSMEPAFEAAQRTPYAPSDAWCSTLDWVRENTPEPFDDPDAYYDLVKSDQYISYSDILTKYGNASNRTDYYVNLDVYYPYPETAYGVLSWWDYGYWITRMAHRLPNANPSQDPRAIQDVAAFFTAQDEETASKVLDKLNTEYIIIDYETAYVNPITVSGKFWAIITWGGMAVSDFFEMYLMVNPEDSTQLIQRPLFYPEYYRSMAIRMYNFDCQAVTPSSVWVIQWQMQQDQAGNQFKVITDARQFTTYAEAGNFTASQEEGNYRIASMNPMVSCTPLEALDNYEMIYGSEQGQAFTSGNLTPEVKVFQYK